MDLLVCVVNDKKKETSSTSGMQNSVKTSKLMAVRVKIVPERMKAMEKAILEKDFPTFGHLTMIVPLSFPPLTSRIATTSMPYALILPLPFFT